MWVGGLPGTHGDAEGMDSSINWGSVTRKRGDGCWYNSCTYILRKFMVDPAKIEKYLNTGPVSELLLVTRYILDSWSREEKGRQGFKRDGKGKD